MDRAPYLGGFVAAQIIHDHDVAFPEEGRELLLDPYAKTQTIDGCAYLKLHQS